jgi:hypothetical protein
VNRRSNCLRCPVLRSQVWEFALHRLAVALQVPVARPIWPISHQVEESAWSAFTSQLRTGFTSAVYWRYLLHTTIVGFSVSFISWCVAIICTVSGLGGLTHWFWSRLIPAEDNQLWLHSVILDFAVPGYTPESTYASLEAAESVMYAVFGLISIVTMPWLTNGLLAMHRGAAWLLLSRIKNEALAREIPNLQPPEAPQLLRKTTHFVDSSETSTTVRSSG